MNTQAIHEGYIKLHKRGPEEVEFTVLETATLSEGRQKFFGTWVFGGAGLIGLIIGFNVFQNGLGLLVGFVTGAAALWWFTRRHNKPMKVTATRLSVSFDETRIDQSNWQAFVIKEPEVVTDPKGERTEDFRIYVRLNGVDSATSYTMKKHPQNAEIINQMNMLVSEALSSGNAKKSALPHDDWV